MNLDCFFHFRKCVWLEIQSLGLRKPVHQRRKILNQREKTYGLGIRTDFRCY